MMGTVSFIGCNTCTLGFEYQNGFITNAIGIFPTNYHFEMLINVREKEHE
jgi:hypothetical protein